MNWLARLLLTAGAILSAPEQAFETVGARVLPREGAGTQIAHGSGLPNPSESMPARLAGDISASPADQTNDDLSVALRRFAMEISGALAKHMTENDYPSQARENGWQGTARVRLLFAPGGKLKEVALDASSGYDVLDQRALKKIPEIQLPEPPPELLALARSFSVRVPISFALRGPEPARQTPKNYLAEIKAKIRQHLLAPPGMLVNPKVVYSIAVLPDGTIEGVRLIESSGVPAYDMAVERAIRSAVPLPVPTVPELFEQIRRTQYEFRRVE